MHRLGRANIPAVAEYTRAVRRGHPDISGGRERTPPNNYSRYVQALAVDGRLSDSSAAMIYQHPMQNVGEEADPDIQWRP